MINQINNAKLGIAILSIFLVFAGCDSSSTDSDSDDNNNNNSNQDQSASFESGDISPGENFSYIFEDEEVVDYYCSIHSPDMTGEVTVTSDAEAVERDTVYMENDQFNPSSLEVAPNTEVIWINDNGHDHNIRTGTPSSNNGGGDY